MLTYALVFHALSRSFAADFSLIVLLLVDRFPALSVFSCLTAIAAPLQRMCMNLNTGGTIYSCLRLLDFYLGIIVEYIFGFGFWILTKGDRTVSILCFCGVIVWKPRRSSCQAHAKAVAKQLWHTKPGVVVVSGPRVP